MSAPATTMELDVSATLAGVRALREELSLLAKDTTLASATIPGKAWTLSDLERLWQAPGANAKARRKWVLRRVDEFAIPSDGSARDPRYLPAVVLKRMELRMGGKVR